MGIKFTGLKVITFKKTICRICENLSKIHFQKVEGFFSHIKKDVVIDFGCGTGKTTVAMAKGEFVSEKPYHVTILYYYIKLQIHRKK